MKAKLKKFPLKSGKEFVPGKYVDRNLFKVNPLKEQFEPTDAVPVNQHKRMAGAA